MTAVSNPSDMLPPRLDIVVPCFNEQEVLVDTHEQLSRVLSRLVDVRAVQSSSRIVYVDDGSRDQTWDVICKLARSSNWAVGVRLSGNRGHQNALLAGLEYSDADAILTIDADLQDDIDVIPEMVQELRSGADLVYGVRKRRDTDTAFKRTSARMYYSLLRWMGVAVVPDHADFRLMSRTALERLKRYAEVNLFLRGIVPLVGHKTAQVFYDRKARLAGETKYPLRRMVAFAVDGITSFSAVPLRLIALLGLFVFFLSLGMTAWVLWIRFAGDAVPGWASSVIPIYFLGGVQLLSIGVVGEYVAKIYLETKHRPRFFIEEVMERRDQGSDQSA
jgi:polyisoprenyl-phosphate glycosyltransferase